MDPRSPEDREQAHAKASIQAYEDAARPLLEELAQRGVCADEVPKLCDLDDPAEVLPAFVVAFMNSEYIPFRIQILSSLASSPKIAAGVVGELIEIFKSIDEPGHLVRWHIADTLVDIAPESSAADLRSLVQDQKYGRDRVRLIYALVRLNDRESIPILIQLLSQNEIAGDAMVALYKLGGAPQAREQIERMSVDRALDGWVCSEAKKILKRMS